jgi:hypothetical protein
MNVNNFFAANIPIEPYSEILDKIPVGVYYGFAQVKAGPVYKVYAYCSMFLMQSILTLFPGRDEHRMEPVLQEHNKNNRKNNKSC